MEKHARARAYAKSFLAYLNTIPISEAQAAEWDTWLLAIEARLCGRGRRRQSNILLALIRMAEPSNRCAVAEKFIRGLAEEAAGNPNSKTDGPTGRSQ